MHLTLSFEKKTVGDNITVLNVQGLTLAASWAIILRLTAESAGIIGYRLQK